MVEVGGHCAAKPLYPREDPTHPFNGGGLGPRAGLAVLEKRKILSLVQIVKVIPR